MRHSEKVADAIVVGGGPSGLSAALLLGRCNRDVILFDDGNPRNARATAVHAYLGLEEVAPADLIAIGRRQISRHQNVSLIDRRVISIRNDVTFRVTVSDGAEYRSRGLILGTGMVDRLPPIRNLKSFFGKTIHTCPYCDGWESTDQKIVVWGAGNESAEIALEMLLWSADVSLILNGAEPDAVVMKGLKDAAISLRVSGSADAVGKDGKLEALELDDGSRIPCQRLFLVVPQAQSNDFAEALGCGLEDGSQARCVGDVRTRIDGFFIAGNAADGIELSMVAAAEGLKAAAALNDWLLNR